MFSVAMDRNLNEPLPVGVADGVKIVLVPAKGGEMCRGMVRQRSCFAFSEP